MPNPLIVLNRFAVSEGNACEQQLDLFGAVDAAPRFSRICACAWFDDARSGTQGNAAPDFLGFLDQLECKQDLTSRLPLGVFIFPDAPAPPDTRMLFVTVLDAETDASGTVTLQAAWTLQSGQPARATFTQQATLKAALENRGAAAQAAALSRILGALTDRIAASVVAR
ncbi:hypothetical protein FSB65_14975 [Paraburkholderia sp. JPY418]|nr:hypothetical protein [Paraburkholderia youngii]